MKPVTRVLCALGLTLFMLSSCGVGVDSGPRVLQSSSSTSTTPAGPTAGRVTSVLYYVNDGSLVPQVSELTDRNLPTVLEAALLPPKAGSEVDGTITSIPPGTRLLSVKEAGDTLTLNLSSEFDNVVGLSRQQAIGQLVLTATERSGAKNLEFEINGDPIQISTPARGDSGTVTACDFAPLLATEDDARSSGLEPATERILEARRASLESNC